MPMYHLTLIHGAELAEGVVCEVTLPQPLVRFAIGRDPANPWPIPDRTRAISACHCEIVGTRSGPVLRDLSTNGTFVNGAPSRLLGEHLLDDGDVFELGPYAIRVSGPRRAQAATSLPPTEAIAGTVPASPPKRSPGVMDTAPVRGGDPAAMLAAAAHAEPAPWGLTEILRHAPPACADADIDVTQIRVAPKAGATKVALAPSLAPSLAQALPPGGNLATARPGAPDELAAQHDRLMAAFLHAARRLANDLSPQTLQAALGQATDDTQKARLWDLYTRIWQRQGNNVTAATWEQGLVDAALRHVAAASKPPEKA
jgi:predicted component of type VI protein secretion system